jgi:hypothetical protein
MKRSYPFADLFYIVFLIVLICLAFFKISPFHVIVPHRDSGIFLHIGSEILQGKVLYQQAWGNSNLLIFFLNAIGLWLGKGSVWGVWGLELSFFLVMGLIEYWILRPNLSPFGSFFVIASSFLTIFQFMSGNFTEEYALLFQIAILAFRFMCYLPNKTQLSRPSASFGIGIMMGLVFCLKQSYIDVGVSVILYIIFLAWVEKNKRVILHLLLIGLGFFLVNISFLLYFFKNDGVYDYITSAFLFNRYYLNLGLLERMRAIGEGLEFLSLNPFLVIMCTIWLGSIIVFLIRGGKIYGEILNSNKTKWVFLFSGLLCWVLFYIEEAIGQSPGIGLLGWLVIILGSSFIIGAFLLFVRKPAPNSGISHPLIHYKKILTSLDWVHPGKVSFLLLGLIDLPIVIFTISLSGRNYTHYFISLFPALFLLMAAALVHLDQIVGTVWHKKYLNAFLAAILISGSFAPILYILVSFGQPGSGNSFSETAKYLNSATTAEEKILMWGWDSVIYFLADREPPTRYGFQFPAYFDSPYKKAVLSTLLGDLKREPPKYIADTGNPEMPLIERRLAEDCLSGSKMDDSQLLSIISFVCSNYEFDLNIGNIYIYRLRSRD